MSEDKKYNGWSNYETWNIALWISNDEGMYKHWRARTRRLSDESLAKELKIEFEGNAPELDGPYADLLNAALSEVDWYEIALSMIAEHCPEPEETEE